MPTLREHKQGRFVYGLDDIEHTAQIRHGHIGRSKTYRVPGSVMIGGASYTITSIEFGAFGYSRTLRHLIIPNSIKYIDEDVFCYLPNLRSIHIGSGVEYLCSWHFRGCPKLYNITIAKDNPHLRVHNGLLLSADGKVLLREMYYHRELNIPEGVQYIEKLAFWCNSKLEQIHFPTTLKEIGDNSFSNLRNLRQLDLPEGSMRLEVQCFSQCRNLELIDLPSTLSDFGRENFAGCSSLRTLILRSPNVMKCEHNDIGEIPLSCRIYVPGGLIDEYKNHTIWRLFENINSITTYEKGI